jgi:ferredoxin
MAHLPDRDEVQTPQSHENSEGLKSDSRTGPEKGWPKEIHQFHLTGRQKANQGASQPSEALVPYLLVQLEKEGLLDQEYPLYLSKTGKALPLRELLKRTVEKCEAGGDELRIIGENLPALANYINRSSNVDIEPFSSGILSKIEGAFDLSTSGRETLGKELTLLKSEIPKDDGVLLRLGPGTLLNLFSWVCRQESAPHRQRFTKEVKQALYGLDAILLVDKQKSLAGRSPEFLASEMGEQGRQWVDPTAFSKNIPSQPGPIALSPARRERIEKARKTLSSFLSDFERKPQFLLVHNETLQEPIQIPDVELIYDPDGISAGLSLCQNLFLEMTEVFKALRVAHLEIAGDYDSSIHDSMLERFDWQSCEADELRAIPPVVVYTSEHKVCDSGLTDLSKALRSGLPLKILITKPDLTSEKELSGFLPDLGYLFVAHREALVAQSTLAQPLLLVNHLSALVSSMRSAVAVVAGPTERTDSKWAWLKSVVARLSRSTPNFLYRPDSGSSWADRFTLEGADLEEPWLTVQWTLESSDGSEKRVAEPLTFAHAAAMESSFRKHFRTIPAEAWSDDQVEIGSYLNSYTEELPRGIPFIWVIDQDQGPARAILTRELVSATRDRQNLWRSVQELAGVNNEYVKRAVEAVREEAESAARTQIEAIGERERSEGAAEAIERLVSVFTSPEALASVPPSPGKRPVEITEQPLVEPIEPPPELIEEEAKEEEEEELSAEPYIDSFLCTSCNDCINLNPLLFKYNADKQAVIGDVSAGTFLELVKAAEACPAKCIHPGTPAEDDETATPEVIARARAFQ